MKQKAYYLILLMCICLVSCTTSQTTISQSADLSKYKYAALTDVMDYQGSAALMDAEVKIYDAIDNSRLQMIGDQAIGELSYEQKQAQRRESVAQVYPLTDIVVMRMS